MVLQDLFLNNALCLPFSLDSSGSPVFYVQDVDIILFYFKYIKDYFANGVAAIG